ncbi:hypothetical protein C0J52_19336 [Blattella germanica]|nr:hypothetical protein C0J52_19336 [Blattella germanica]
MQDVDTFEQIKLKKMAGQFTEDIFTPLVECQQCFRHSQCILQDLDTIAQINLNKMARQFIEDIFPPSVDCKQCVSSVAGMVRIQGGDMLDFCCAKILPVFLASLWANFTVECTEEGDYN